MSYLAFVLENRRFLAFGLVLTFVSSFGQTFYIALFGDHIRAEFGLSHGGFGTLYSLATLTSALALMWLGRKIDDVDLRLFSGLVCAGLIAACLAMALMPASIVLLYLAVFGLRFSGQGMMGHTAATSMARYFEADRGKAMSLSALGYPAGEAVLPAVAVALISAFGWRGAWLAVGIALGLVLVPLVLWLLGGHGLRHRRLIAEANAASGEGSPGRRSWTRAEVLRDPRFYLILPVALAAPMILTGLFFHQVYLADTKGWSLAWLATCFVGFAAFSVVASLATGPLVDRFGAVRLLPYFLVPLALGLLGLGLFEHKAIAMAYMVSAGISGGASRSIMGAAWAEIYGIAHIGAIRALTSALLVFSTALAPAALGWLIDAGVAMETVVLLCFAFVVAAIALIAFPVARFASYARP